MDYKGKLNEYKPLVKQFLMSGSEADRAKVFSYAQANGADYSTLFHFAIGSTVALWEEDDKPTTDK